MATGGQPPAQISDITTCSICQETFIEPKALPCLHTFCLHCLDTYCADKDQQQVACPLCRKLYTVPPGGNVNLPNNFFILQLLQVNQSIRVSENEAIKRQDESAQSAEEISAQLKDDVDKLTQSALEKPEKLKQLEIDTSLFVQKIGETQSKISQKCDQLVSLIQSHKSQLIEELDVFKAKILKEVEKEEIDRQFVIMDSFLRYCLEVMNIGTARDQSRTARDLHARVEDFVKNQEEPSKLSKVVIAFKPSFSKSDDILKIFGKLILRDDTTENIDFTKMLERLAVCHVMPSSGQPITGITVLGGDVYVTRSMSQVYIYNSDNFTLIRNLTITGLHVPWGLISCSHFNCLYVRDGGYENNNLYRYDVTNNVTTKWSVGEVCSGLSITKSYNLLATLWVTKRIQEYTTDGSLIREISLDSRIDKLRHCVQLSTGNYVVCHAGTQLGRLCIVDKSGCIIQTYDGLPGSGVGQLYYPRCMAVDTHDNILVVDTFNKNVQVMSSTLSNVCQVMITGHQLKPFTLHFDESSRRLYIGEYQLMPDQSGRMFVLDITV